MDLRGAGVRAQRRPSQRPARRFNALPATHSRRFQRIRRSAHSSLHGRPRAAARPLARQLRTAHLHLRLQPRRQPRRRRARRLFYGRRIAHRPPGRRRALARRPRPRRRQAHRATLPRRRLAPAYSGLRRLARARIMFRCRRGTTTVNVAPNAETLLISIAATVRGGLGFYIALVSVAVVVDLQFLLRVLVVVVVVVVVLLVDRELRPTGSSSSVAGGGGTAV
mmetsp:Transcript_7145/g.22012  ORF Transcript_7145/g.22012 Transcript_7145/m.22012 type:complete len:223 (+) Transcript_7145:1137-1805(+)